MELEFITIDDIKNRDDNDYKFIQNGYPLSGYVQGKTLNAQVTTFDEDKVTLTRTSYSTGRLNAAGFRVIRDLKALAEIVDNITKGAGGVSKAFVNVTSNDNEAGFLKDKLVSDGSITLEEHNDGDTEELVANVSKAGRMFFSSF